MYDIVEEFWISPTRCLVLKKQQFSFEKFFLTGFWLMLAVFRGVKNNS